MRIDSYHEPTPFREAAWDFLAANEAMNNVFFGIIEDAERGRYDGANFWGVAFEGDQVVGAVLRTPPWPVAVAHGTSPQALTLLLDELWDAYDDDFAMNMGPGLAQVANRHRAIAGRPPLTRKLGQLVYQASTIATPAEVPGSLRLAVARDGDLVDEWGRGFDRETESGPPPSELPETWSTGRHMIKYGELYIWEVDGRPVSMTAARGPTPHGIRISYVYTPPALRRNGYASACVAAVSQRFLDEDRGLCFLFTDVDNPTSNHIYQELGYEFVGETNLYAVGD